MRDGERQTPSAQTPELSGALPGMLGLLDGLAQAWPELAEPSVEAGLHATRGALPVLRFRPKGAPEVLVAWVDRSVRERALSAWLGSLQGEGSLEVFLFDPAAAKPAPGLLGYALEQGRSSAIPNRDGLLESRALGVSLRAEGARLRVVLPGGEGVPFPDELAQRLVQARAELGRWRQKVERKESEIQRLRVEAERQKLRAEHWKSEARRLRAELGEAAQGEDATAEVLIEPRQDR